MNDEQQRNRTGSDAYYGRGYGSVAGAGLDNSGLRYYLDIVRRRLWTVLAILAVATTIGMVKAVRVPHIYQATAKVMVERKAPSVIRFEGVVPESGYYDPNYYATQVELARSRDVLTNAFSESRISEMFTRSAPGEAPVAKKSFLREIRSTILAILGAVPAPPAEPWEVFRGQFRVSHLRDTHFLLFRATSSNPQRAALVVNSAAQGFESYHKKRKQNAFSEAAEFLQIEKNKQEKQLIEAETGLQKYREEATELVMNSEAEQPALRRLAELSERLTVVQMKRVELTAELRVIKEVMGVKENMASQERYQRLFSLPSFKDDDTVSSIHGKLVEARKETEKLLHFYGPAHPLLLESKAESAAFRVEFRAELRRVVLSMTDKLRILTSQEAAFKEQQKEQQSVALDLAKETFNLARLENAVKRHQRLYDALVERMGQIDVSSGYVKTAARIVEKSAVPTRPIPPQRGRVIVIAILLGLGGGVGVAFLFENLDDTIKTPEDLKARLELPMLGFIPRIDKPEKGSAPHAQAHGLISLNEPTSSIVEAYRGIRTRLFFSVPDDADLKILGFTSCSPGEGKTTTASNLALVTSMAGKRVLLIDADFHRPRIHRVFGISNDVGLSSILTDEVEDMAAVQRMEFDGEVADYLDIITAGPESPNPSELLGSEKMRDFFARVRGKYDWVFVDMPPILFISDASIMSALCEGVLLVVKSAKSNRSILARTKEQLEDLNAKVIGCVLNDVVFSRLGRYYSDYHYYGYSRYTSDYQKTYSADRPEEKKAGGKRKGRKK